MTLFDYQPELVGDTLHLRPLRAGDYDGLYKAASDPAVWAGHPAKDRHKADVFEHYFQYLFENRGTLVAVDRATSEIVGCSRFYDVTPSSADAIAIGYTFLAVAKWGGPTNGEMKQLMLEHAFKSVSEVWFHIGPDNVRSQKAISKIGAAYEGEQTLEIGGKPTVMRAYCMRITNWKQV